MMSMRSRGRCQACSNRSFVQKAPLPYRAGIFICQQDLAAVCAQHRSHAVWLTTRRTIIADRLVRASFRIRFPRRTSIALARVELRPRKLKRIGPLRQGKVWALRCSERVKWQGRHVITGLGRMQAGRCRTGTSMVKCVEVNRRRKGSVVAACPQSDV
jgi:hypothetical protein